MSKREDRCDVTWRCQNALMGRVSVQVHCRDLMFAHEHLSLCVTPWGLSRITVLVSRRETDFLRRMEELYARDG